MSGTERSEVGTAGAQRAASGDPSSASGPAPIHEFVPLTQDVPCDFCGGTDFVFFADKMRHGLNLKTVLCGRCALAQTNPQPTAGSLATFYSRYYHSFHRREGVDEGYLAKSAQMTEQRFALIARFVDPQTKASLLEVGPGAGTFLAKCQDETVWSTVGIEPGLQSYQWCRDRGLNVVQRTIEEFASNDRFSIIVAYSVMDHLRSPKAFLTHCHSLLAADGLLVLEVKNLNRLAHPREGVLQFPALFVLTAITLLNYLHRTGFRPLFLDDTGPTLKVIARRHDELAEDFIAVDLGRHLADLNRKNRFYRLATWIPPVSIFAKIRAAFRSV